MKIERPRRFDLVEVQAPMVPPVSWVFNTIYTRILTPLYQQAADWLLPQLAHGATVWDIGCGPARSLQLFLQQDPHVRAVGVDPSPAMIRASKKSLQAFENTRYSLQLASAENLDVSAHPFDALVSLGSIKHWQQPSKALHSLLYRKHLPFFVSELNRNASDQCVDDFVSPLPAPLRQAAAWQLKHRILPRAFTPNRMQSLFDQAQLQNCYTLAEESVFVIARNIPTVS